MHYRPNIPGKLSFSLFGVNDRMTGGFFKQNERTSPVRMRMKKRDTRLILMNSDSQEKKVFWLIVVLFCVYWFYGRTQHRWFARLTSGMLPPSAVGRIVFSFCSLRRGRFHVDGVALTDSVTRAFVCACWPSNSVSQFVPQLSDYSGVEKVL